METKYKAAETERRIYQMWEASNAFAAGANARPGADPFCIMIPPPNVTGVLHMGHAFNNTLQDILIRWHRMRGFDVLWQPGQDHAGIATQMVVERSLAEAGMPSRKELGREKFLEKVWNWKENSGGAIINQLKRLGASCDWSRNRFTMDTGFHDAVLKVFIDLYEKGYIFKGKRLVNWDPHSKRRSPTSKSSKSKSTARCGTFDMNWRTAKPISTRSHSILTAIRSNMKRAITWS